MTKLTITIRLLDVKDILSSPTDPTLPSDPIVSAFHIATPSFTPHSLSLLSFGNTSFPQKCGLVRQTLFEPSNIYSKDKLRWAVKLGQLSEEGWRLCYTDGTGRGGHHASAFFSEDNLGNTPLWGYSYLGTESTVADAERQALVLALQAHRDTPLVHLLSDSASAISSAVNLSLGIQPPRSEIETNLVALITERDNKHHDTAISWLRSHIGIRGNEEADKLAAFASALGQFKAQDPVVTEGGIRQLSKASRAAARTSPGFGIRRSEWNRHALSAYTWCRTDRGPQKSWLSRLGKATSSACPCGHHTQDGRHLVFACPQFHDQRQALGSIKDWEDLDRPIYSRGGGRGLGRSGSLLQLPIQENGGKKLRDL